MQQTQLVQQLMFGVRMNRETAGSKQQPFNAIDVKMFHLRIKNNSFSCHYALLYLQNLATSFYSIIIILKGTKNTTFLIER